MDSPHLHDVISSGPRLSTECCNVMFFVQSFRDSNYSPNMAKPANWEYVILDVPMTIRVYSRFRWQAGIANTRCVRNSLNSEDSVEEPEIACGSFEYFEGIQTGLSKIHKHKNIHISHICLSCFLGHPTRQWYLTIWPRKTSSTCDSPAAFARSPGKDFSGSHPQKP